MFYKLLQTIAKHRMKKLQITKCSECCDSHIDIKPRTSDTVMNSESDLRNKHSESEPRPKIDDKAGVSNMEIDHNKINECHTSNSLSHGKTRLCDSKPVCSNVCPQKSSSVQAEVDCVDITMSSEEKTDKPKEMSPKYTIDKTVEASEVICHMEPMDKSDKTRTIETEVVFEAGTVVSSDMSKTGDMFRHLNLHPKHPDDNDHMVFDLFRIESVLQEVLHDEDHKIISTNEELESARQLLKRIQNSVNDYDKK